MRQRSSSRQPAKAYLEALEQRLLLSGVTWTGAGDGASWIDPNNWSTHALPGAADDVTIGAAATTITLNSGTQSIHSLSSSRPLTISYGSLQVATTAQLNSSLTLSGGILIGGTWSTGAGAQILGQGGSIDGVTWNGSVLVTQTLRVLDGLTINGTVTLDSTNSTAELEFDQTETLGGTGQIRFTNTGTGYDISSLLLWGDGSPTQLTIGSGLSLQVSNSGWIRAYMDADVVVNQATIVADGAAASLELSGANINQGMLRASNGGSIFVHDALTMAGAGTFDTTSGTMTIWGTLENTGRTLALTPATGSLVLELGGTILGGQVSIGGGAQLICNYGTLDGVTLNSDLTIAKGQYLEVRDGLVLNSTLSVSSNSSSGVSFFGTQTVSGSGEILFPSPNDHSEGKLWSRNLTTTPAVVTIASTITILAQADAGLLPYGNQATWINQGTIRADGADVTLDIDSDNWVNSGRLQARNGGTVQLDGTFTTAGLGSFDSNGGTVLIAGTMDNSNATLTLTPTTGPLTVGSYFGTIKGGDIAAIGGVQLLSHGGTLDGVVLDADATIDELTLKNGLILNGTLTVHSGGTRNLYFDTTQTIGGTGAIVCVGPGTPYLEPEYGSVVTIASSVILRITTDSVIQPNSSQDQMIIHGSLEIDAGATLYADYHATIAPAGSATLVIQQGGELDTYDNVTGTTTNASGYRPDGQIAWIGQDSATDMQILEVMGKDLGAVTAGFVNNFAYGSLDLGYNSYVQLVDQSSNSGQAGSEALYVNSLVVPSSATLDLNGLHIYARAAVIDGVVLNGTVTRIPDGGPIAFGVPTAGNIGTAGQLDEWTFYGRAGHSITAVANPGSSGSAPALDPLLGYAEINLLDAQGNVLATNSGVNYGQIVSLDDVTLPGDGTYRIQVEAPAGELTDTGNYTLAVWDVTTNAGAMTLGQQISGHINTPYSVDRWNFSGVAGQQVRLEDVNASARGMTFTLTGPNGWTGFTAVDTGSDLVTLPSSGSYTLTAHGSNGDYDEDYSFVLQQTAQADLILGTPYQGTFAGDGGAQLFRITLAAGTPLKLNLTDLNAADQTELYVQVGAPPTRGSFQYSSTSGGSQQVLVPWAAAGTWYVLVYGDYIPSNNSAYTLLASGSALVVNDVTPDHLGNGAAMTLTVTGAGFDPTTTMQLVAGASVYTAASVEQDSYTRLSATFASGSVPAGQYTVRLRRGDGATTDLAAAFTVSTGGAATLAVHLELPASLGYHVADTIYVDYTNTGNLAMAAPLLVLDVTQNGISAAEMTLDQNVLLNGFWSIATAAGFHSSIQFLASGKIPGVLLPGETVRTPVYWAGWSGTRDMSHPPFDFTVSPVYTSDTTPLNLAASQATLQPDSISTAAWNAMFPGIVARLGSTWGAYVQALDNDATYLAGLGETVTDVQQLYSFEVDQSNGFGISGPLTQATDAAIDAPGPSLNFTRVFPMTITGRYAVGILGQGWQSSWNITLAKQSDGTIVVTEPDGLQRTFLPDSRGGYNATNTGDQSVFTSLGAAGYRLREADGTLDAFNANGTLDYVEDLNGNRITCGYAAGSLTTLTDSAGPSLTLAYNGAGRLTSITDSAGRQTTYTYDAANLHLLSVQDPSGSVTSYTYVSGQGAARENALASITGPATQELFSYDSQGRLVGDAQGGVAETYTYAGIGTVTAADALGDATTLSIDNRGLVLKMTDPLGNAVCLAYDDQNQVTSVTDAAGRPITYTYDAKGNLLSVTDALGGTTHYTYGTALDFLTSAMDADGNVTRYAYDTQGDLTTQTAADATQTQWTYDAAGLPTVQTDARGKAIAYTYDSAGQVTAKTFSDGTHATYAYDAHGNLTSTTDSTGTTGYTYNTADQLTRIDYPGARSLVFTYDAAGRRLTSTDQTGYKLTYSYDTAGRLSGLKDSSGTQLVTYTYDAAGRLTRQDLGNGDYTTWQYDAAGDVLHLVNAQAGGTVLSRFDYTYDSRGRCTALTTLSGTWTYQYDDNGQLTHAVFASTDVSVASQDLSYSYDAAGNRTQVVANGTTSTYSVNNLNQYTSAGSTTYTYDADGNLTQASGRDGVTQYGWDDQNHLISVVSPQGTWHFTWDALGNMVSSTKDGVTTNLVIDPAGLGNVVGTYSSAGALLARYTYGLDLVSSATAGGTASYFDTDALGSVTDVTNALGAPQNQYTYGPFGDTLAASGSASNPFGFVGALGVTGGPGDLLLMRQRAYDSQTGRFLSTDPLYVAGANGYTYAANQPLDLIDPTGLKELVIPQYDPNHGANSNNNSGGFHPLDDYRRAKRGWDFSHNNDDDDKAPSPSPSSAASASTASTGSKDPNDKTGPAGTGTQHFVAPGAPLSYRVDFENDPAATAPAQFVNIIDQLDPNIDRTAFSFTQFGFGDTIITVPADTQHFQTSVSMTYNGRDFDVHIQGDLDLATGVVQVQFSSIDPTTGLPPSADAGFLPPEDGTGRGMGYFTYSTQAKTGLATGVTIHNVATIQFDFGEIIATDQVSETDPSQGTDPTKETLVTIDAGSPTSSVHALPATESPNLSVSWSGTDDTNGSGIGSYDVYVSDNGGAFTQWLARTTSTSSAFIGTIGHTYGFYSIATDNVGNVEASKSSAEAQTTVVPPTVLGEFGKGLKPLVITDTDGTKVTFTLSGLGTGTLTQVGSDYDLTITGTTGASALTIKTALSKAVGDDGKFTLHDLTVANPLNAAEHTSIGTITASTTDLTDNITITGVATSLTFGNVANGISQRTIAIGTPAVAGTVAPTVKFTFGAVTDLTITSAIRILSLTATNWRDTDSTPDRINAPSLGTLSIAGDTKKALAGDFAASLHLTALNGGAATTPTLGTVTINGGVSGTTWDIGTGNVGSITIKGTTGVAGSPWQFNNFTNLTTLTLGDVVHANVTASGTVGKVSARRWTAGSLSATTLTTLTIAGELGIGGFAGDFGANLTLTGSVSTLPALGTASIAGSVGSSTWSIAGKVGTLTIKGTVGTNADPWQLKNVTAATALTLGDVTNATVSASGTITTLTATRWSGGSLTANTIGTLKITGAAANKLVGAIAGDFDASLTLTGLNLKTGVATLRTASVKGTVGGGTWMIQGDATTLTAGSINALWQGTFDGRITSLTTTGSVGGTLSALAIGTLKVGGDLSGATLTLNQPVVAGKASVTAMGTLTVTGSMTNSTLSATGNLGTISLKRLISSSIFAGVDTVQNPFGTVPDAAADFLPTRASLGSLTISGITGQPVSFGASVIAAANLGTIKIKDVPTDGTASGGIAGMTLKSYARMTGNTTVITWPKKGLPTTGTLDQQDTFMVRLVV